MKWQCKISSTLGELERPQNEIWGTKDYENDTDPTVFMGIYSLPDFYTLWKHKGQKAILWCGGDILRILQGYWLEDGGGIKLNPKAIADWINKYCDNYCENAVEYRALESIGIGSTIIPSFLGNIDDYQIEYKHSDTPNVYASVSGDNFKQYGWDRIEKMAPMFPEITFHLYGNVKEWKTGYENVIVHGRVPKEQMNEEIKKMQGGLRMLEFDGASEILMKSILWGQYPISLIEYDYILKPKELDLLKDKTEPNVIGREHYRKILNKYVWNKNNKNK